MDTTRCHVLVCTGAGCVASGSMQVLEALRTEVEKRGLSKECKVIETGCLGPCAVGPVAVIYPDGVFYQGLEAADAAEVVEEHLLKGRSLTAWSTGSRRRRSRSARSATSPSSRSR